MDKAFVPTNEPVINDNGILLAKGTAIVWDECPNSEETFNNLRKTTPKSKGDYLLFGLEQKQRRRRNFHYNDDFLPIVRSSV